MTNEKTTDLFIEINRNLGEINAKMSVLCKTIEAHEQRISKLEQNVGITSNFKDRTIELLVKCILIGITGAASLAGAGGLLKSIIGAN